MTTSETQRTDGLIEALKAAIDEDERIALATMLTTNDDGDWIVSTNPDRNDAVTGVLGQCIHIGLIDGNGDLDVPEQAFHIARQNPARTLAMVAAHREILALHRPRELYYPEGMLQCEHCADLCHADSGLDCEQPDAVYPCPTIVLLAKGYGIEVQE